MSTLIINPGDTTRLRRAVRAEASLVDAICFVLFQCSQNTWKTYFILFSLSLLVSNMVQSIFFQLACYFIWLVILRAIHLPREVCVF